MSVLIIYANPKQTGHCATMFQKVVVQLKKEKQRFEIIDLYKEKFDPVLMKEELQNKLKLKKDVLKYQEKIRLSKKLIFIYPVWWNNMPAILKGFTERVLTAKFAFEYKKRFGFAKAVGLLKDKKAAIFITTGSPRFAFRLFLCSRGKHVLTKDILNFCGIKNKTFHHGKSRNINDKSIQKISVLAHKGICWLLK